MSRLSLVYQINHVGVELFFYANPFFCFNKQIILAAGQASETTY